MKIKNIFSHTNIVLIAGAIVLFTYISFYYTRAIFEPNSYLFVADSDGLKNYFTYAYQIKNDTSFIHTKAVNYPYGEHCVYLDSQPFLSFIFKVLTYIFPVLSNYSVGFINLFMMLSIIVAYILIYLIFIHYQINRWLAALAAVSIVLLSPQFYRLWAHYGLSYMWVIPGIWLYWIKLRQYPSLKKLLIGLFFITSIFFIHSYLGTICSGILLVVTSSYAILFFNKTSKRLVTVSLMSAIIPIFIYFLFVSLTDNHIERTESPVGLFIYHARLSTIFLPVEYNHYYLYNWLLEYQKPNPEHFEGTAYVGFFVNISIIISFFYFLFMLINRKTKTLASVFDKEILLMWLVSIIFLLIALEKPLEDLIIFVTHYIKPIKQFRALGRFSWIFYYLINIAFVVILYRIFQYFKKNHRTAWFFLVPFFFIPFEAHMFHNHFSQFFLHNPNPFIQKNLDLEFQTALQKLKNEKYQAIIPLPFFHFGSDDIIREPEVQNSRYYSMLTAYHLNQSLVACNTGRTSVAEAKNIMQILLPEFYPKSFKNDVLQEPFLVLYYKGDSLLPSEKRLLDLSELILETDHLLLKRLSYEKLFAYSIETPLYQYFQVNDSSHYKNGFVVSDTSTFFYFNSFDNLSPKVFHSKPTSFEGNKKIYNHLAEFKPGILKENETYEISFWYYNKGNSRNYNIFIVEETDENNNVSWIAHTDPRFSSTIVGDWSLVQFSFKVKNNKCLYKIFSSPMKSWQDTFFVDDLLIKPTQLSVFRVFENQKKGILFYNNHFIETNIPFAILDSRNNAITNYFIKQITHNTEWLNKIKHEATQQQVPLEENIIRHAQYMIMQTWLNATDIEELKIQYYVHKIKSDKQWFHHIISKPENKGKNIDSLLIENAKFVIYN
ncbi:MAG: hypothetical protein N2449_00075 [Bacteroidales bacterium]|nr:hypothetical protein [Bacteroidales bacterium]